MEERTPFDEGPRGNRPLVPRATASWWEKIKSGEFRRYYEEQYKGLS